MKWSVENNVLVREFNFKSQSELAHFLLKVAQHADKIKHHPDFEVSKCGLLKMKLFTHDKNEITILDYELAAFIDLIKIE